MNGKMQLQEARSLAEMMATLAPSPRAFMNHRAYLVIMNWNDHVPEEPRLTPAVRNYWALLKKEMGADVKGIYLMPTSVRRKGGQFQQMLVLGTTPENDNVFWSAVKSTDPESQQIWSGPMRFRDLDILLPKN